MSTNYFEDDKKRNKLAECKELKKLKQTYKKSNKKNPNTNSFWNNKIEHSVSQERLDNVTKDRLKYATNFVDSNIKSVIDLGLGYGDFLKLLSKKLNKLKDFNGIDISKTAVEKIQKTIPGEFKVGNILNVPFNRKFDCVVSLEVLEHIQPGNIFKAFREIKRLMNPQGQFILSVPVFEQYSFEYNPNHHMRAYTPTLIKAELQIAGFKINKSKEIIAFQQYYALKKIISKFLKNKWRSNIIVISCTI